MGGKGPGVDVVAAGPIDVPPLVTPLSVLGKGSLPGSGLLL